MFLWYNFNMTKLKNKALLLRKQEKTYAEIQKILGRKIPKSTLSYWFRGIDMPDHFKEAIRQKNFNNLKQARILALQAKKDKRELYLADIRQKSHVLKQLLKNQITAKLVLAVLYMCEGSRSKGRSSLMFVFRHLKILP